MRIKDLLQQWEESASATLTAREYCLRLPVDEAAKIAALAEMYPLRTEEQIITELVATALAEVEVALPYVQGPRIIAEDDQGDPIYEDIGPTPRFLILARKHAQRLAAEQGTGD